MKAITLITHFYQERRKVMENMRILKKGACVLALAMAFTVVAPAQADVAAGGSEASVKVIAASKYIGKAKAKKIAVKHANKQVDFTVVNRNIFVKLDRDDYPVTYDVSFTQNGYEFDYEINAKSGKIIDWDIEAGDDD